MNKTHRKTLLTLIDTPVLGASKTNPYRIKALKKILYHLDRIDSYTMSELAPFAERFFKSKTPVHELEAIHGDRIWKLVTDATEKAYIAGMWHAEKVFHVKTELQSQDRIHIDTIASQIYKSFWDYLKREESKRILGAGVFDFIAMLARMLSSLGYNEGTVSAGIQISADIQSTLGTNDTEPVFEFVTMRDDRVDCRICAPLDGIQMSPSDLHFTKPPLHRNCRCVLKLIGAGNYSTFTPDLLKMIRKGRIVLN